MKYKITLEGRTYVVEVEEGKPMLVDEYEALAPVPAAPAAPAPAAAPEASAAPAAAAVTGEGEPVNTPIPGTILQVKVSAGQQVKKGDVLIVLEAMKMENEIIAARDGTITQVVVQPGATVETGATLLVLK
ncbi:MAG: biotin/lipoyl-binding protein [Clostridia bacterium]|nr:biotin/lipoyl-binding protein [Clostridia bacterium]